MSISLGVFPANESLTQPPTTQASPRSHSLSKTNLSESDSWLDRSSMTCLLMVQTSTRRALGLTVMSFSEGYGGRVGAIRDTPTS